MLPFRDYHLTQILEEFDPHRGPLDRFLYNYFRANKALGSKDRKEIAERVYNTVRWHRLIDYTCTTDCNPHDYLSDETIPLAVRLSFPDNLLTLLVEEYGEQQARSLCLASNEPAPTTIRVNTLKITRKELLDKWKEIFPATLTPCQHSDVGITFSERVNFFSLDEFQKGFFEVQDEGSQLIAHLVEAQPRQQILDYCAGSGGKTLAFAPQMQGTGQIYLHDIRKNALQEARKRLKRAGIENAQTLSSDSPALKKHKKQMDWVLVDAPCSGTGTLRRNPDMKWRFSQDFLTKLIGQQRHIFEKALSYLRPDGKIVYATCSILAQENEKQVEHFMRTYNLEVVGEPFKSLPTEGGMDGFFGAVLQRK